MTKKKDTMSLREMEMEAFEKACGAAKGYRAQNRKLRQEYQADKRKAGPLRKALIADLLRVYESPDNPFAGFAASRKRYRELGHFPELFVTDFFGNHQEFLRAAGLHDSRTTTRTRNKAAKLHSAQNVARYAEREVAPWANRYEKAKGKRKHLEVLIGSDFHSAYVDPFALDVFLDACEMVQPDIVCLNGDVFDFPQMSSHRKLPGHFHLNVAEEIEFGRKRIFAAVRERCPDAQIDFVIGNHEYRMVNYIADACPALACLPCLEFSTLFGLAEYEINLVCRSSFLAPTARAEKNDVRENWTVYGDCYAATHGISCAKFAAQVQLETYKMSGTSGHTHRPQIYYGNSLGTGGISWMSTPMMATPSASPAVSATYMPQPSQWNGGFGHVAILPGQGYVSQQIVQVHPEWASWAGRTWTPSKKASQERDRIRTM